MDLPKNLKTPEEMFAFSRDHGYGTGFGPRWGRRTFQWVRKNLKESEPVYFTFAGLHRFRSMSAHQRNFGYAITDNRIVMGQVRAFGLTRLESVPLNQIQNIAINYDSDIGIVSLILHDDIIGIGMARETAEALGRGLTEFLPTIQALAWQLEEAENAEAEEPSDEE